MLMTLLHLGSCGIFNYELLCGMLLMTVSIINNKKKHKLIGYTLLHWNRPGNLNNEESMEQHIGCRCSSMTGSEGQVG